MRSLIDRAHVAIRLLLCTSAIGTATFPSVARAADEPTPTTSLVNPGELGAASLVLQSITGEVDPASAAACAKADLPTHPVIVFNRRGGFAGILGCGVTIELPDTGAAISPQEAVQTLFDLFPSVFLIMQPWHEVVVDSDLAAPAAAGDAHVVRLHQELNGVPIFGTGVVARVAPDGRIDHILGNLLPSTDPIPKPVWTVDELLQMDPALAELGLVEPATLVYYDADPKIPLSLSLTPAWIVGGQNGADGPAMFIVEASTGSVLAQWSLEKDANKMVRDGTQHVGLVCMGATGLTDFGAPEYSETPPDCCPACLGSGCSIGCILANCNYSSDMEMAILNTLQVHDTWLDQYGWEGLDNALDPKPLISVAESSTVSLGECAKWVSADDPDSCEAAFFAGDGHPALNVVGHEFQHGVASSVNVLQVDTAEDQNLSIDEHLADVNGVVNEVLHGSGSWIMGSGSGCSSRRNVCDPTCTLPNEPDCGFFDYCDGYVQGEGYFNIESQPATWNDFASDYAGFNGGHYNDGIGNKLAWLLGAPQGTSHIWGGATVQALGVETMGHLLFKLEVGGLPPTSKVTWDTYRVALEDQAESFGADVLSQATLSLEAVGLWAIRDYSRTKTYKRGAFVSSKTTSGRPYLWHFHRNFDPYQNNLVFVRCGPGYDCQFPDVPSSVANVLTDDAPAAFQLSESEGRVIYSRPLGGGHQRIESLRVIGSSVSGPTSFGGVADLLYGPAGTWASGTAWYAYVRPQTHRLNVCKVSANSCSLDYSIPYAFAYDSPAIISGAGGSLWVFWPDGDGNILYSAAADPSLAGNWSAPSAVPQMMPVYGVPTTSTKAVSLGAAFGRVYMSYVFEEPGGGERAVAHVSFKLGAAPALNDLSRAVLQNHLSEPLSTVDDPASAGALFYWGSRLWFAYSIDLTIGEDHEGLFFKYKKGY